MVAPSRTGTPVQADASAGNYSAAHTVPAGANLVVAFWSHWDGNASSSASALSINGVAMTIASQLAEGATTDENGVGVAYLVNPATGSQTHALTWSAGGARSEGGELCFVYYQDANTSDPVRVSGTNAQTGATDPTVALASVATTDRVVGFVESYISAGGPVITGVTAFIDNTTVNSNIYDVGDDTGLSGTVNIGTSNRYYASAAGIVLKEIVAGSGSALPPLTMPPMVPGSWGARW